MNNLTGKLKQESDFVPLGLIRELQESLRLLERIQSEDRKVAICGSRAEAPQDETHDLDLMIPGHLPKELRIFFAETIVAYLRLRGYKSLHLMRLSYSMPDGSGFPISENIIREQYQRGSYFAGQHQVFVVGGGDYHRVELGKIYVKQHNLHLTA